MKKKKVVVIGGGTGSFVVLSGLKKYPLHLTAVVSMSDSGGSNKRLRDEFGLLPTSDIRSCLVALSEQNGRSDVLRKLFMYRFEKGKGISGMTFGNLFMAALTDILGSQKEAIAQTSKILRVAGSVLPVTYSDTQLYAEYENGSVVTEEHFIDEPTHDGTLKITKLMLKPHAIANPEAVKAIDQADFILLGPGDLYTSILPNFLVKGIAEAVQKSKAKKVYTLNLMTKYGQTYQYSAGMHLKTIEMYIGKNTISYVLLNDGNFPKQVLQRYEHQMEFPVVDDLESQMNANVMRANFVGGDTVQASKSDLLKRSLVRHDPEKLANALMKIINPSAVA